MGECSGFMSFARGQVPAMEHPWNCLLYTSDVYKRQTYGTENSNIIQKLGKSYVLSTHLDQKTGWTIAEESPCLLYTSRKALQRNLPAEKKNTPVFYAYYILSAMKNE